MQGAFRPCVRSPHLSQSGERFNSTAGSQYAIRRRQVATCTVQQRRRPRVTAAADGGNAAADALPPRAGVTLVGAGPGPADLLTLRAVAALSSADCVVYDDLGAGEEAALRHAPPGAERVYVGKRGGRPSPKQHEIDALLVDRASRGLRVVRLKGGCPAVFSRVGSEMRALAAAGYAVEIVPGVSSALAAPLLAGFPLTDTHISGSFAVTTGHDAEGTDWAKVGLADTLVVLMGGSALPVIADKLLALGRPPDTPVAVVRAAGCPDQRVWRSKLASVAADTAGEKLSPCIIVVGAVADEGAFGAAEGLAAGMGGNAAGG